MRRRLFMLSLVFFFIRSPRLVAPSSLVPSRVFPFLWDHAKENKLFGEVKMNPLTSLVAILCFLSGSVHSVIVQVGQRKVESAMGSSVILQCSYHIESIDTGDIDVEWAKENAGAPDTIVITYSDRQIFSEGKMYADRVSFIGDVTRGNASMKITNLLLSDSATYDCKVKSSRKVDRGLVFLAVYEKPSEPVCSKSGSHSMTYEGTDLTLRCSSKQGSIPITYTWHRITGPSSKASGEVPSTSVQDVHKGTLLLRNVSTTMSGTYGCTATNRVWEGSCTVSLNIISRFNRAGIIAGAVLGSLLALLLLLLLLWCCCCRRRRKHLEEDGANDIREDVPAPVNHSVHSSKTYVSMPSSYINLPASSSDVPFNAQHAEHVPTLNGSLARPIYHPSSRSTTRGLTNSVPLKHGSASSKESQPLPNYRAHPPPHMDYISRDLPSNSSTRSSKRSPMYFSSDSGAEENFSRFLLASDSASKDHGGMRAPVHASRSGHFLQSEKTPASTNPSPSHLLRMGAVPVMMPTHPRVSDVI
uniref:coxsackievirus and adenovirus receptor-like n=1 Tax=Myxine glutinosa TaxID=7769 RepID=UPI00358E19C6